MLSPHLTAQTFGGFGPQPGSITKRMLPALCEACESGFYSLLQ
jgi:hypothetical protein